MFNTKRSFEGAPARRSLFGYDNDKDLTAHFLVTRLICPFYVQEELVAIQYQSKVIVNNECVI